MPAGDSVWVLTRDAQVFEVAAGKVVRTVRLGAPVTGITVADDHPVAVTSAGKAYVVDSDQPHAIGDLGMSGSSAVLGSWRGAGRYVLAVDRTSHRVSVLDPRTGRTAHADLPASARARLDAPVVLGSDVYVPDYSKPQLWKIDASSGSVRHDALRVPGKAGDQFDLTVSGGRVWANSQYDRRALIVDGDGRDHTADKGAGPDVHDSQAGREAPPIETPAKTPAGDPGESSGPPTGRPTRHQQVDAFKAPSVIGLSRQAACRLIRSASLTCVTRTDPNPVTDPGQVAVVSQQDPSPGTTPGDKKVTITYPDRFTVPSVLAQTQGEACSRLKAYKMTCRASVGRPATGTDKPGTVYQQTPLAGSVASAGSAANILYFSGTSTTHAYSGQSIDAACAQVEADGFECQRQEGATANGTGQQPNTVYQQNPPPNTKQDIKRPVMLTFYSGSNDLPSYVGGSPDAACADITSRGFQCNQVQQVYPSTNKVEAQDQPAGRYPLGTAISIHYSPWQTVDYWIYQHNSLDVWVLRPQGDIPAGYGRQAFRVGAGYKVGATIPGGKPVNGFFCTVGGGRCRGMDTNHFYSLLGAFGEQYWQGPDATATFMDCGVGGTTHVYRVWKDVGAQRLYSITSDPASWGAEDNELLGCVWP